MALAWLAIDVDEDPEAQHWPGDPADAVDAIGELLAFAERPWWHSRAACRGQGPAAWFPERGQDPTPARQVCSDCPVAAECATAGLSERDGIWGGLSGRQRRTLRCTAA